MRAEKKEQRSCRLSFSSACLQFLPEEGEEEIDVDGEGDKLGVDKRQGNPGVGDQCVVATRHIRQVLKVWPIT